MGSHRGPELCCTRAPRSGGLSPPLPCPSTPRGQIFPGIAHPQVALLDFGATREFDRSFTDLYIQVEECGGLALAGALLGPGGRVDSRPHVRLFWCLVTVEEVIAT